MHTLRHRRNESTVRRGLEPVRTAVGCVLAFALLGGIAAAQDQNHPSGTAPPSHPAPVVSYSGGQLHIDVLDWTLGDLLTKVAALTGAKLDLPAAASTERVATVQLGPGSPRQILTALLNGSGFDYVILGSDTDPDNVQKVMLIVRGKGGGPAPIPGGETRSVFARHSRSDEHSEPPPTAAQAHEQLLEASAAVQSSAAQSDTPPPPLAQSLAQRLKQDDSIVNRPGAMSPPATLNAQSMSQQLQQMYQQRAQMVQQDRQTGLSTPQGTGSK